MSQTLCKVTIQLYNYIIESFIDDLLGPGSHMPDIVLVELFILKDNNNIIIMFEGGLSK